jgi:RND family efflux transporter MFP subunit
MDISSVIAKAHIPQSEASILKIGDPGTMTVPGIDKPVQGKVTVVSPALDPNSTTVEVWLEARNPNQKLKPGTSVQLSLTARIVKDALIIPVNSVLTAPDGTTTVMLAGSDGRAHQKPVRLGIRNGDDVQVVDGLAQNDRVISNGAYGLPDKTKINIASSPEAPAEGENKPAAGNSKTASEASDDK